MQTWTDDESLKPAPRPRTGTVIALLGMTALIVSYLATYAITNALAATGVVAQWSPDSDPRPRRFVVCFVALVVVFAGIAMTFRWVSRRQLQSIDRMEED